MRSTVRCIVPIGRVARRHVARRRVAVQNARVEARRGTRALAQVEVYSTTYVRRCRRRHARARVGRRSSRRRGWELIAHCLEHFSPSQALERHFVQFVSGANPSLLPLLLMNLEDQDGLI